MSGNPHTAQHGGYHGGGYRNQPQNRGGRNDYRGRPRDYQGGGGGGYNNNPPPREHIPTKIRGQIYGVGEGLDFEAAADLPRLAKVIQFQWGAASATISPSDGTGAMLVDQRTSGEVQQGEELKKGVLEGFRFGITEQPQKLAYYATLILLLSLPPAAPTTDDIVKSALQAENDEKNISSPSGASPHTETEEGKKPLGRVVLEDLESFFLEKLSARDWRCVRTMINLFASLSVTSTISPSSLLQLLQSFLSVTEELTVSISRASTSIICVGEALLRCAESLCSVNEDKVNDLVTGLEVYVLQRPARDSVLSTYSGSLEESKPDSDDTLTQIYKAVLELRANDFKPPRFLPTPHSFLYEPEASTPLPVLPGLQPFELQNVLVPPDDESDDITLPKWVSIPWSGFHDEVVPSPATPSGWILRSLIEDLIHIYSINRREAAKTLMGLPNWFERRTFKPPPNTPVPPPIEGIPAPTWSLESIIVSTMISSMLSLPYPPHKVSYFTSLLVELCKLSAATVAPPVGQALRNLYKGMGDGLDVECSRRVCEWWSCHLSNFGFGWVWKDWIPDLNLTYSHPKKSFMRRLIELETRLSYYDRIKQTLPEEMRNPENGVIADAAEEPVWEYEDPSHAHYETSQLLLNLFKNRTAPHVILEQLATLPEQPAHQPLTPLTRSLAVQTLLFVGARSFSHFLNATERYLPFLRGISTNEDERMDILHTVSTFWVQSPQMKIIITDKLMQYGIIQGTDIVKWVFSPEEREAEWIDGRKWDILKLGVDKVNGRVVGMKKKVKQLEVEDEQNQASRRTGATDLNGDSTDMVVEFGNGESKEGEEHGEGEETVPPQTSSQALTQAQLAISNLQSTQKLVLVDTAAAFVHALLPTLSGAGNREEPSGLSLLLGENGWSKREEWGAVEWKIWAIFGWWKEFCRCYIPYLRQYSTTIDTVVFSPLSALVEGSTEAKALELVTLVWRDSLDFMDSSS